MNLSQKHQLTFDEFYPEGYVLREDEKDYFHIMYIDIKQEGKRTRDVPCVQKYSVKDWVQTKKIIEKDGISVTGHDEYAVLHDPTVREAKEKPVKAEVKPGAKPKGRPPQK